MNKKSQFFAEATGTGYTSGNFLLDSLSLATADTRGGFDQATAQKVENMTAHVNSDPHGANARRFNEYIAKITPAQSESKPAMTVRASTKPGSGMM